jgi:hypothetical protein
VSAKQWLMPPARRLPVILAGAALAVAGCGQSDDRATVRSSTHKFLAAYSSHDGATACAALSQDTRKELESEEKRSCRDAIGQVELKRGAVTRVQVMLTNAKVDLDSGESVFLSKQKAGWRISAIGCKPQGKPTNTPFDCELQA